ncbi:DUF4160 domain-containing protein [Methylocella sp.]|uniref:DUF4160 domain-containing protein n=1 Tax=Methylocella sp. TaxID=1978226 RepID=UPI0035B3D4B9
MPTIARLSASTVNMYASDHLPPHFHVRMNDGREALVEIATMSVIRGAIPARELAEPLKWARANADLLARKWLELNP